LHFVRVAELSDATYLFAVLHTMSTPYPASQLPATKEVVTTPVAMHAKFKIMLKQCICSRKIKDT